jgi:hypothetical protein
MGWALSRAAQNAVIATGGGPVAQTMRLRPAVRHLRQQVVEVPSSFTLFWNAAKPDHSGISPHGVTAEGESAASLGDETHLVKERDLGTR